MRSSRALANAVQLTLGDFRSDRQKPVAKSAPVVAEPIAPYLAEREEELEDCLWSPSVALDRKHRPQVWDEPSSTVRREWCRYPQEAHLLDEANGRYRKLTADEVAILQGFEPQVFHVPGLSNRTRMKAIGDAVPPPLAAAVLAGVNRVWTWKRKTSVEVCAGSGGLGSGATSVGLEHLKLVERWEPACRILDARGTYAPGAVAHADVREFDFSGLRGRVGLLSGGPPCQPWSQGGLRRGVDDPRDLLAWIHTLVGTLEPEVFVFENVPGLTTEQHTEYREAILDSLRRPTATGAKYGVMAGVLNAADYGVPQIRRRVFIVGFRDAPNALAYRALDRIYDSATHRDPSMPHAIRKRWRTVRDALAGRPDPGGWRKWITAMSGPASQAK